MRAVSKPDSRGSVGWVGVAPMAASFACSTALRTACAHQARPLTLRWRRVLRGALGIVFIEGGVDAAQDGFEGNARLAPCLDQRPVERGEHEQRAAALLEAGLRSR